MAFQFLCPQGHLLQGEESQAGQQCKCPYCQVEFVVPHPTADVQPDGPHEQAAAEAPPEEGDGGLPSIVTGQDFSGSVPSDVAGRIGSVDVDRQEVLHIRCPQGHVLETPRDMLGQDAMCPHCQSQFRLSLESSVEYRRQRDERAEQRFQKAGKNWLHWAIAAAVVVLLGLILMIALVNSS